MRARQVYTLLPRTMKAGRVVWYYRTYDGDGQRTTARSTGCHTKTAAHAHCQALVKAGRLIPDKPVRFAEYSKDFWVWGKCKYVQRKLTRGSTISQEYVDQCRTRLETHILSSFGPCRLSDIKTRDIEAWVDRLLDSGLAAGTVTQILGLLKQMLTEAVRRGVVNANPAADAQGVTRVTRRHRRVLTLDELRSLLDPKLDGWIGEPFAYALTVTAVATACRLGELLALRWMDVRADSLLIRHSLKQSTRELKSTKTNQEREVPVPKVVSAILHRLGPASPEHFVFAGSATPLAHHRALHRFRRALTAIGLTKEQQLERAVSFHSLRHMSNSLLRGRVADETLRMVTGHATPEMTDLYSHTLPTHLDDVREAQEAVIPQLTGRR